jgi:adenine phosphoribosyltransferase
MNSTDCILESARDGRRNRRPLSAITLLRETTVNLADAIRTIPDYPKRGIMFRDITTLLGDAEAFSYAVEALVAPFRDAGITKVAGIEARGFILGGAIAHQLKAGFVPLRKRGKLPGETYAVEYALEYGVDAMEMHRDALDLGEKTMLIDDLIATGGTALAAVDLLRRAGAEVVAAGFVIDLPDLNGAAKLAAAGVPVSSLVAFPGH